MISPIFADVDTSDSGAIYYRVLNISEETSDLNQIISSTFSTSNFQLTQVFVATFEEVPEFDGSSDVVSDPQLILSNI